MAFAAVAGGLAPDGTAAARKPGTIASSASGMPLAMEERAERASIAKQTGNVPLGCPKLLN